MVVPQVYSLLCAQKDAIGCRIVASSRGVLAYTKRAYRSSPAALELMRWILLCASVLRSGRPSFSASVYTRACCSKSSPVGSSSSPMPSSSWLLGLGPDCTNRGVYSPVYRNSKNDPTASRSSSGRGTDVGAVLVASTRSAKYGERCSRARWQVRVVSSGATPTTMETTGDLRKLRPR